MGRSSHSEVARNDLSWPHSSLVPPPWRAPSFDLVRCHVRLYLRSTNRRGLTRSGEQRARRYGTLLFVLGLMIFGAVGCAPKVWSATAIQPSQPGDTKEVWIYLHTDDDRVNGVYRCYDDDQKPVCKRAKLVTK